MSNANETQVGGNHYSVKGDKIQHWDLSIMYEWDVFQYQITKYIMRAKDKHSTPEKRLEDLKKARHFLDKYIENWDHYDPELKKQFERPQASQDAGQEIAEPLTVIARPFDLKDSNNEFQCEGHYGDGTNLYKCKHCGTTSIRARSLDDAYRVHGACAMAHGYLSQP